MSLNNATPSQELIERVVEVTGTNAAEAEHLLAACANDVDAAVALYFEQGPANDAVVVDDDVVMVSDTDYDDQQVVVVGEEVVRAPIAPIREQLIGPEDDNFYATAATATAPHTSTGRLGTRMTQRVKVCPLRDFAREGALMEAQLQEADGGAFGNAHSPASPIDDEDDEPNLSSRSNRNAHTSTTSRERTELKRRFGGLCDLFRPPTDINYAGKFQSARKHASDCKFWLLVNVQSDNFDSQLLNRDVWSDKDIRSLISKRYLLWQVDAETWEGRRFVAFYHCAKLPYICIIDPRTGEEVWKCQETKQSNILKDLREFLEEHKDFNGTICEDIPTPSKRPKLHQNNGNTDNRSTMLSSSSSSSSSSYTCTSTSTTTTTTNSIAELTKRAKVMELSEEEQMLLAIKNSMRENGFQKKTTEDDNDNCESNDYVCSDDDDCTPADCESFDSLNKKKNGNIETEVKNSNDGEDNAMISKVKALNAAAHTYKDELGMAKNELTMLKLRLFNAVGNDEVIELRWPSDTKLRVLRHYVSETHKHIPSEGYKLICAFPRKTFETAQDDSSLKELGLHPSANLHLTLDD